MTLARPLLASLLVLGVLVAPASADIHPNNAPGFPVDQSFHVGDIDSVNLFNGGLALTIPLGGTSPVGGGFSCGLKLAYNANAWVFDSVPVIGPNSDPIGTRTLALPSECSNAGLGWRISFGRLDPPARARTCWSPIRCITMKTAPITFSIPRSTMATRKTPCPPE
jgi:hypothetical protein